MLRSTTLFALALGFAAPVAAAGPALVSKSVFEGQEFSFVSRMGDAGAIQIEGAFAKGGQPFRFTVKPSGVVRGTVGATPVEFRVSQKERDRLAQQIEAYAKPQVAEAGAVFVAGSN